MNPAGCLNDTRQRPKRLLLAGLSGVLAFSAALADEVSWEGGITAVYQVADDDRADSELTASADLFASLRRERGEWLLYIEASTSPGSNGVSAYYPTANADAGSVLSSSGNSGLQISELNYTFLMENRRSLMLGLIDPSAWLDRGRIANDENKHFLNGSFVNNATIAFPDYTLGGVFRLLGSDRRTEYTVVISGSDGIADTPDRSYQDLLDLNEDGRGVFLGTGASWLHEHTSWRVGAWLRNDGENVDDMNDDNNLNYGVYGVFGWQVGANAMNVRTGIANSYASIAERFVAIAYQRDTALGVFGIGIARTQLAEGISSNGPDDAFDSEMYLRIPILGDSGHITPSVQYLEAPDIDASDSALDSSAFVASLRFHWSF